MKGRVSALPGMMNSKELGTLGATVDYVGPRAIAGLVDGMEARAKVEMWMDRYDKTSCEGSKEAQKNL
ncbi:hypothetical protein HO173_009607 [Letharia columbiana]|uniref:Uncharacterized protein n=1 Tax=Letharia columbiana TaxID=112416 RepID=A0A8H6FPC2_9LECA|nr:uncharacterized protein HO173_009607 [Letharia columbiana]KAF6232224.1 hypothetical protein HO173_009607 [Letharia columbiana]